MSDTIARGHLSLCDFNVPEHVVLDIYTNDGRHLAVTLDRHILLHYASVFLSAGIRSFAKEDIK